MLNTQERLRFGVLGPLEMRVDGVPVSLGTPKQRAVLATLLINRNRPVAIDALIDAVWEQDTPSGARPTIYAYVSNLRHLMANSGVESRGFLSNTSPGYRLAVLDSQYDLGEFVARKGEGMRATADGRFEEASDHFSEALAQWRGPVLDDLRDFGFADAFASGLEEDKVVTRILRAEVEIARGRASSVISELEKLAVDHPYREPLWAQLISAYYVADRQADALDAYQRLRQALADDLGVDPGPTVRGIHKRILCQEPLDVRQSARSSADDTIGTLSHQVAALPGATGGPSLRDANQRRYPVVATTTRIGRSPTNDIVLHGARVSRHHAAIVDTGSSFVVVDLKSVNGVYVSGRRIRSSATLHDGDRIRISDHHLIFEANYQESMASQ
ncbi:BTAD domain-containing putative transcriptional regulator [Mycobacterium camsae]|uniref:BTAD domain-containing putative transcriptional regulator n=1 Tax=Mycobacterium gordonae TaxID=1778 RepID=UPI00197D6C53|nr:BTAD domain-containing putative transcriptional regulator [Mycobacterium gordonae]